MIISRHAQERMGMRGIPLPAIAGTLIHGEETPVENGRSLYALGPMRVIIVPGTGIVVTAWAEGCPPADNDKRRIRKHRQAKRHFEREHKRESGGGW